MTDDHTTEQGDHSGVDDRGDRDTAVVLASDGRTAVDVRDPVDGGES